MEEVIRIPVSSKFDLQNLDAIVLAGGESKRMGLRKALLPLGDTTLIEAVICRLRPLFRQVVVVTREPGDLEGLDAVVVADHRREQGPMVGLARGLSASDAPWCFLVGCDMPFVRPEVIRRMSLYLDGCDVVAARVEGYLEPLHAFYSRRCLPVIEKMLDEGETSLQTLFRRCKVTSMDSQEFLDIDPELLTFRDLDTEDDYKAALRLAQGLEPQEVRQ